MVVEKIKKYIEDLENQEIYSITLPTFHVLIEENKEIYKIHKIDGNCNFNIVSGIFLTIENYPGRNRGFSAYFSCRLPFELDIKENLEGLKYLGKKLHFYINKDDLENENILNEKLKKFCQLILAFIYLYKKEVKNE